jgi:hypothetical protein
MLQKEKDDAAILVAAAALINKLYRFRMIHEVVRHKWHCCALSDRFNTDEKEV